MAQSVGKGLYKEAIGTSEEVPDVLSILAEIAYEMYEERRSERQDDSVLNRALDGLLKVLWDEKNHSGSDRSRCTPKLYYNGSCRGGSYRPRLRSTRLAWAWKISPQMMAAVGLAISRPLE